MEFDAAVGVDVNAIEHLDDGTDADHESGFLERLSLHGGVERFADIDNAARQAPLALEWFVRTAREQHAIGVAHDHGAHAHDRIFRETARHTPITFTTTRFLR
jgi:hypothetical protein